MNLLINEVLQKVSNAKTKAEKKKLLVQYNTNALRAILIANFDDSIVSELPPGDVPYTPNDAPEGTEHSVLEKEYRKLYLFFRGGSTTLKQSRREELFIQMLEGLHPDEADLVCLIKDKGLSTKYKISKQVVEQAFPDIRWGDRS